MKTGNVNLSFLALSAAGLLFGGYFAFQEWFVGPTFVANDGLVWTLPLVTYVFLALASSGVSILMAAGELFDNEPLKTHKALLVNTALSLLIGAFAALATELGSLMNVVWLIFSPNFSSPIWWMGTLYAIELVLLAMKFYSLQTNHRLSFDHWLTVTTLCLAIATPLILGSVFGTIVGRAGYYGVNASIFTLLCALASAVSLTPLLFKPDKQANITRLGRFALAALAVLLVVNYLYLTRSSIPSLQPWAALWMPILLLFAFIAYHAKPALSAIIALPTLLITELAFIIQGQVQVLGPKQTWLGAVQSYQPNLAELGILAFGCSIAYLCFVALGQLSAKPSEE